jgi:hypothetical protein
MGSLSHGILFYKHEHVFLARRVPIIRRAHGEVELSKGHAYRRLGRRSAELKNKPIVAVLITGIG